MKVFIAFLSLIYIANCGEIANGYSWHSIEKWTEYVNEKVDFDNLIFQNCNICGKPCVNEYNIWILRGMTALLVLSGAFVGWSILGWIGFSSFGVGAGT